MTEINVGDKVKVTLGESVVVGKLARQTGSYYNVTPEGAKDYNSFGRSDGWVIEKVLPALPTGIGAVVQFNNEPSRWVRTGPDKWATTKGTTSNENTMNSFIRAGYRLTVISEGVAL